MAWVSSLDGLGDWAPIVTFLGLLSALRFDLIMKMVLIGSYLIPSPGVTTSLKIMFPQALVWLSQEPARSDEGFRLAEDLPSGSGWNIWEVSWNQ